MKLNFVSLLFVLWIQVALNATPHLYFSGDTVSVQALTALAPSPAKRAEIMIAREGRILKQYHFRMPSRESYTLHLPVIKNGLESASLELEIVYRDDEGKILESNNRELRLMNREVETLLHAKVVYYSPSMTQTYPSHVLLEKIDHRKIYHLENVKADMILADGLNFDRNATIFKKLLSIAKEGTVVLILSSVSGHLAISNDKDTGILFENSGILNKLVEGAMLPASDKVTNVANIVIHAGRPMLKFSPAQEGWHWVEFRTAGAPLVICTIDLSVLVNRPDPYLLIRSLLESDH